uniref:NADH dehydrogenase subunit 6 n=1 Tax=Lepidodermella squamata TaxID=1194616 RepID=A0A0F6Q191_9BILA|nr:NADH dehydrogenase subunit 6 [Lepidodermella squamata]AKD00044.1 NADH dehydrogenase subunit 6 [Lepidodermella squamata]
MLWSFILTLSLLLMLMASILTQPAALGWMLLALTAILMLYYYLTGFYWGAAALFIIFIGGLLVAFSLISATASNWTLVEYSWAGWVLNIGIVLMSTALLTAAYCPVVTSTTGQYAAVSSAVDMSTIPMFWLVIFGLIVVMVAGVKLCLASKSPLHWLS